MSSPLDPETASELIANTQRVTQASEDLAAAMVEYQERARLAALRYRRTMRAVAAGFTVVLVAVCVVAVVLYARQTDANNAARDARSTIIDCIQPSADPQTCFAQGQQRTAQVIGNVQRIIVLAASCAPDFVGLPYPQRAIAISQCIAKGLK